MLTIKKAAKNLLWFLVRYSGIPLLVRELFVRKKVAIIVYHDPNPQTFRKHMEYLSKRYIFISIRTLADALHKNDWSSIPPKPLIVTIDDGHKGNIDLLPVIKRYQVMPTIYVCTHIINTNRHFWWKSGYSDFQELKQISRNDMLRLLKEYAGYSPKKEYPDRQALNEEEIKVMSPYVNFQSHSKYHPILPNCSEDECLEEIRDSRAFLEKLLGKPVESFAYPNGDYGEREIAYLKLCGYKTGRMMDWGWNTIHSDPLKLRNMNLDEDASINKLCAQVSGCYRLLQILGRRLGIPI